MRNTLQTEHIEKEKLVNHYAGVVLLDSQVNQIHFHRSLTRHIFKRYLGELGHDRYLLEHVLTRP